MRSQVPESRQDDNRLHSESSVQEKPSATGVRHVPPTHDKKPAQSLTESQLSPSARLGSSGFGSQVPHSEFERVAQCNDWHWDDIWHFIPAARDPGLDLHSGRTTPAMKSSQDMADRALAQAAKSNCVMSEKLYNDSQLAVWILRQSSSEAYMISKISGMHAFCFEQATSEELWQRLAEDVFFGSLFVSPANASSFPVPLEAASALELSGSAAFFSALSFPQPFKKTLAVTITRVKYVITRSCPRMAIMSISSLLCSISYIVFVNTRSI
jgi:hypothetical protein